MRKEASPAVMNQYDEAVLHQRAIYCLIRKLDRRIIPFMVLLEISRFGFQIAISPSLNFLHIYHTRNLNSIIKHLMTTFNLLAI
jgi:hypothetical protein